MYWLLVVTPKHHKWFNGRHLNANDKLLLRQLCDIVTRYGPLRIVLLISIGLAVVLVTDNLCTSKVPLIEASPVGLIDSPL